MFEAIILILLIGSSPSSKERDKYTSNLGEANISFYQAKSLHNQLSEDPEIKFRLREVCYIKWCIETRVKFHGDGVSEVYAVDSVLQDEAFENEMRRRD
jgi:hypothetical protein